MKSIIALVTILTYVSANTQLLPSGYLADTPEVAQAKAAHFAEKAKAAYAAGSTPDYYTTAYNNYYNTPNNYINAPSVITVLPNGYLADTPEVAAAKAAFLAEHAKASYAAGAISPVAPFFNNAYIPNNYYNDQAVITVLPNGYLADTPEVAAAKSAFFAEQARSAYSAGANNGFYISDAVNVLPNGYLADTPEVAAAKASFFSEFAKASTSSGSSNPYYSPYYTWNGYSWVANQ